VSGRRRQNEEHGRDQAHPSLRGAGRRSAKPVVESRLQDFVVITASPGRQVDGDERLRDAGYFCVDNLPPEMTARSWSCSCTGARRSSGRLSSRTSVAASTFEALRAVVDDLDVLGLNHHPAVSSRHPSRR